MTWWRRLFGRKDITSSLALFREVYGGGRESRAGPVVNLETTLEDATAFACMRVIAEGIAQVPWHLYRDVGGRKEVATDHPLDQRLHLQPNTWQTSFEFRETLAFHLLAAGNAYVFVNRVGTRREVRELVSIEPRRVEAKQEPDYSLSYWVSNDRGERKRFGQDAIWHLRGPSWNAWAGLDAIKMARHALGLSASLEQGQSEFQKNGANLSGLVSVDERLDKGDFELLEEWVNRHKVGGDRSHAVLIADRGAKFTPISMTGVDQQLLETRRHQIEEVCRRFRVMPLMVGHPAEMAARAATESIFLQHVVHTMLPWYERIEQSASVALLSDEERAGGYYTKFNANALMRGAAKDRAEYFAKALGAGGSKGWMTQNDVRALEEMDRSDDPEADKLPQPAKPAEPAANGDPADPQPEPEE